MGIKIIQEWLDHVSALSMDFSRQAGRVRGRDAEAGADTCHAMRDGSDFILSFQY